MLAYSIAYGYDNRLVDSSVNSMSVSVNISVLSVSINTKQYSIVYSNQPVIVIVITCD